MKKIFKTLALVIFLLTFCTYTSYAAGPFTKLGRGLANIITGWMEVFITIHESAAEHGYIGGGIYGFPPGVVRSFIRTSIGLYEVATFPLPFPNDYEAIVEPEFVLGTPFEKMP